MSRRRAPDAVGQARRGLKPASLWPLVLGCIVVVAAGSALPVRRSGAATVSLALNVSKTQFLSTDDAEGVLTIENASDAPLRYSIGGLERVERRGGVEQIRPVVIVVSRPLSVVTIQPGASYEQSLWLPQCLVTADSCAEEVAFELSDAHADWSALEREADATAIATAMIEAKALARSKGAELTHLILASAIDASVNVEEGRTVPAVVLREAVTLLYRTELAVAPNAADASVSPREATT